MQRTAAVAPDRVIEEASLPVDLRAKDGTGTTADTLRATLRAIHRLRLGGQPTTLAAIVQTTGHGRMTVVRSIEVLGREDVGLVFCERQRKGGKQAANHYALHWTKLAALCRDEALALFARRYGASQSEPAGELSTVAAGQSTVAGELSPVTVPPRDSARGGKGGRSAPDFKEEEEPSDTDLGDQHASNTSSTSSFLARHGTLKRGHGTLSEPAEAEQAATTWKKVRHAVRNELIARGVFTGNTVEGVLNDAERRGVKPSDILALCECFDANPLRRKLDGASMKAAVEGWDPALRYDAPGLWLGDPLPEADRPAGPKSARELADDREHERNLVVRYLRKQGHTRDHIDAELVRRGHAALSPPISIADELRQRLKRNPPPAAPE